MDAEEVSGAEGVGLVFFFSFILFELSRISSLPCQASVYLFLFGGIMGRLRCGLFGIEEGVSQVCPLLEYCALMF